MKKTITGTVVSNKMTKTVVISVVRKFRHPKYHKIIVRHKKFKVHNPEMDLSVGDVIVAAEVRPISKDKTFQVVEKIK